MTQTTARSLATAGAAVLLAIAALFAGPTPARAADPTPSSPQPVRFEAGTHTGYRFDSAWRVTASRTATLTRPSGASAIGRRNIGTRGTYLRISNGLWAGYWVPESGISYIRGSTGRFTYAPPATIRFAARTYIGYRFSSTWALTATRTVTLAAPATGSSDQRIVIDGRRYVHLTSGPWAGYWIPGTSAAPTPITCTTGSHATGGRQVLRAVPNAGSEIALTFDMGGRLVPARSIVDYLLLERVCTTVFPTGVAAQTTIGRSVMAVIAANPALFEVGNHTQHHCNLRDGGTGSSCPATKPTAAFIQSELTSAQAVIESLSGQSPVPYWRPPYGAYDTGVLTAAAAVGYTKTILWSIDTIDWRPVVNDPPGPTAYAIAQKIRANASAGGIVLMHLGGYNTRDALPYALAGLRAAGYRATSLSDLFRPG